ncbi:Oidioi.mRNA.OKI2018_I69.XSR.g14950.t1.cds [Oikopleura dioica]|uniref:Oidioi.mRNA.OKI2018_I69.XSR.g14950.t1.cds n=1 Tax=Oikopleura dioica TaxID=34765 RepID=A0ABN7SHL5_OIKDI|nr:Oidioi.mRNA.OKI2018_I69.XSR.g14950.t1.cds [Oikopleura dioica]
MSLIQPKPSRQAFKIVIKNEQKLSINARFTGIMKAKGHKSPFANQNNRQTEPILIQSNDDGATRSRKTSFMSESEAAERIDAIDGAFKRAMKKVVPELGDLMEGDEERSEVSVNSSHKESVKSAASSSVLGSEKSTLSGLSSVKSDGTLVTDITTASERSSATQMTSTTTADSIINQLPKPTEKMDEN